MSAKAASDSIVRNMNAYDIEKVADLYRTIAITSGNHRIRLSRGEGSFERRGGMFIVHNEDSLRSLIHTPSERVIVGEYKGSICGSLWFGPWEEGLFDDLTLFHGYEQYDGFIGKYGSAGKLAYAKEIIVQRPAQVASMAIMLFAAMMESFVDMGYQYATGRLYRVEYYEDSLGRRPCRMLNIPCNTLLTKSGGLHIGQTAPMRIDMDGFSVVVTPQIFLWDTQTSADILHMLLKQSEI